MQSVDIVFPVIHGMFGEDGELQYLLEQYQIPFVGPSSASCREMFNKHTISKKLKGAGFATLPQLLILKNNSNSQSAIADFFRHHALEQAIVKPVSGGSSIGVSVVKTVKEAVAAAEEIFARGLDSQALLEPFCKGREFTVVLFENMEGEPVALIPTEVEIKHQNHPIEQEDTFRNSNIFDYRKKYLPTNQAAYHTPPRFSPSIVKEIRDRAAKIFTLFKMRDFVRLDGWLMSDGTLYFTDINPISGMEQNSFLFRQASLVGMTHRQVFEYILKNGCSRYGIVLPQASEDESSESKKTVYVLFGSHNAERQVSLMSGTNVWLKLLRSKDYFPSPYLLDPQGMVWELPYSYTLNHTVEEIYANCLNAHLERNDWSALIDLIQAKLKIPRFHSPSPHQMTMNQFLEKGKLNRSFIFIALHGGEGENGGLQQLLEDRELSFNGSSSQTSALCMDKYLTGKVIQQFNDPDIETTLKKTICFSQFDQFSTVDFEDFWGKCVEELAAERLIIKPRSDGCSAGIVLLQSAKDLERYSRLLNQKYSVIPPGTFKNQSAPIEMPSLLEGDYLLEPYIETDEIVIENEIIHLTLKTGWVELTVGVLEHQGIYHALSPSITVAAGAILSLEEKFQGGTGINLTPPPIGILSHALTEKVRRLIEKVAKALKIENYARLDVFFNRISEKMILIEVNSLPALTPSTVIYHQGLAENPPLSPLDLLEKIITSKVES